MKSRFVLLALPVFLSSCLIPDLGISAHVGYMQLATSGHMALQDSAGTNPIDDIRIDLDSGFDISEADTPFADARAEFGNWEFGVSGFYYDDSSSSSITQDFGDIVASPGSPTAINSDLTIFNVKGTVAYKLLDLDLLDLSAGIAIDYFEVNMDVSSAFAFENMSFSVPAPMLYGRAATDIWILTGSLELAWIDLDLGDASGSYFDLNAMVSVPILMVEVVAGYRNIVIDVEGDIDNQDFGTHLKLTGWYIGAGVTF